MNYEAQVGEITAILESIDTAVMITDQAGHILCANTALARMIRHPLLKGLGKTFAELTGRTFTIPWREQAAAFSATPLDASPFAHVPLGMHDPAVTSSRCLVVLCALLLLMAALSARAAEWPQYMGPARNGVSPETGLARTWPAGGPPVRWSVPSTLGYGGTAVRDGEVFFLEQDQAHAKTILRCLALETGVERWRFTFGAGKSPYGALSTPTVDARAVYVIAANGEMHCVDRKTHRSRWHLDLVRDFHGTAAEWGVPQSPLRYRRWVIVAPQSPDAGVVSLDAATGKVAWKSAPIGVMGYTSPYLTTIDGVAQLVMIGKGGAGDQFAVHPNIVGLDPRDGRELWRFTGWRCDNPIPWPTDLGDGRFFLCAWYAATGTLLQVGHAGGAWTVTQLYTGKPYMSVIQQNLYYRGALYVSYNGLTCLAPDGTLHWSTQGKPSFGTGSFLIADGMIYHVDSNIGLLYLIDATPTGYHELAKAQVLDGKEIYMPLALAHGLLILRDKEHVKCVDVRAGAG